MLCAKVILSFENILEFRTQVKQILKKNYFTILFLELFIHLSSSFQKSIIQNSL